MWDDVWRPESYVEAEISAAILDDRRACDKAHELDISVLQEYKYEKNIEKYRQFGAPKAGAAIQHSRRL
jgi:BioD-like phosphotransacetylase family protein